jgi:hypothetical protein
MRDLQRAIAVAAGAGADELENAYRSAVAEGAGNTRCDADQERAHGALRLLTLALLRLPDLTLQAHLLDVGEDAAEGVLEFVLDRLCDTSSGALRLSHRALEAHAEAIGYDPDAWVGHALERARAALAGLEPTLIEGAAAVAEDQAHLTTIALTRAAAATAHDGVAVADELATGLAHLLALFMIASELIVG